MFYKAMDSLNLVVTVSEQSPTFTDAFTSQSLRPKKEKRLPLVIPPSKHKVKSLRCIVYKPYHQVTHDQQLGDIIITRSLYLVSSKSILLFKVSFILNLFYRSLITVKYSLQTVLPNMVM